VRAGVGAYAGTKHALEALAQALRLELVHTNVRISNVQPGLVLTGLHDHMEMHPKDAMGIDRPLLPEDVARAVLFVLEQPAHVRVSSVQVLPGDQEI
jgi:NADP-dependent 3-hydroxy acid dehydrogenase YdfG